MEEPRWPLPGGCARTAEKMTTSASRPCGVWGVGMQVWGVGVKVCTYGDCHAASDLSEGHRPAVPRQAVRWEGAGRGGERRGEGRTG
eukprot:54518-Chlamydomonas_euryale.AAC.2